MTTKTPPLQAMHNANDVIDITGAAIRSDAVDRLLREIEEAQQVIDFACANIARQILGVAAMLGWSQRDAARATLLSANRLGDIYGEKGAPPTKAETIAMLRAMQEHAAMTSLTLGHTSVPETDTSVSEIRPSRHKAS